MQYEDIRLQSPDGITLKEALNKWLRGRIAALRVARSLIQRFLNGWLIPATRPSGLTILLLHDNAGNISHRLEKIAIFHHVELLRSSYMHWAGQALLPDEYSPRKLAHALDEAPFALVSHGIEPDLHFNYSNCLALKLFEMTWEEFTALPLRLYAETTRQEERQHLLEQVSAQGYAHGYSGVRISRIGQRFIIRDTTIWNLIDK